MIPIEADITKWYTNRAWHNEMIPGEREDRNRDRLNKTKTYCRLKFER